MSSYSNKISLISWGYNRDKEDLPQINIGLFCDITTGTSLFYKEYNGYLNDFSNLPYVIKQAKEIGITQNLTLVMDGGFCVSNNFDFIKKNNINVIIGATKDFGVGVRDALIDWVTNPDINIREKNFPYQDELYCYREITKVIANTSIRTILYRSPKSYIEQELTLTNYLNSILPH